MYISGGKSQEVVVHDSQYSGGGGRGKQVSDSEASLIYGRRSTKTRAPQRNPVSASKQTKTKRQKRELSSEGWC